MSNDQPVVPQSRLQRSLVPSRYVWPVRVLVITFFLLIIIGGPIEQLVFGWLYFLMRVVPKTSADWPTALLGVFCVIAFVIGLHYTLSWFLQQSPVTSTAPVKWRLQSTIVIASILVLMFAAGTAMVGATHQFIWWLSSSEPTAGDEEARAQLRLPSLSDAVRTAQEAARRTQAKNNLKQLGLAMHNFADTYECLPPGGIMRTDGTLMHGWAISLSGYGGFYAPNLDYSIPWNEPPNDRLFQCEDYEFVNPCLPGPYFDQAGYGLNHYAANIHVFPIRTTDQMVSRQGKNPLGLKLADITDGTSNTIMLGTVVDKLKPWGHPANVRDPALGINRSPDGFGGPPQWHGGMFLMCDGSVRFLDEKTDPKIMQALGTPASGDAIPREIHVGN